MSQRIEKTLREAPITNNCPECFNQDLTLKFTQEHQSGRLMERISREVRQELRCNTCGSVLFPISWTPDIERSVEYYAKLVQPERVGVRLKPLFYLIVVLVLVLAGGVAYAMWSGLIPGWPGSAGQ